MIPASKKIYAVVAVLVSIPAQWSLEPLAGFWDPPIITSAIVFLFWQLPFWHRVLSGIILGLLFDTLLAFPFGSHLLVFMVLALLTELLRKTLTNTDSFFTKGLSVGLLIFTSLIFIYPLACLIGYLDQSGFCLSWAAALHVFFTSLFWSVLLPLILMGLSYAWSKKKR